LRPCDESLATQIEEGYIKLKPFRTQATTTSTTTTKIPSPPQEHTRPPLTPSAAIKTKEQKAIKPKGTPDTEFKVPDVKPADVKAPSRTASPFQVFSRSTTPTTPIETAKKEMIWKLLGDQHMGKYVVYTNATTAWLLSDDLYGKLTSSVYQTLSAGVHLGGAKLVRGYIETAKKPEPKAQDKVDKMDKDVSGLKPATLVAKVSSDEVDIEAAADTAEEKEMERDYDDSEHEDPNRYHLSD
jgi:hypothetical protein